jgi:hypothetical protein
MTLDEFVRELKAGKISTEGPDEGPGGELGTKLGTLTVHSPVDLLAVEARTRGAIPWDLPWPEATLRVVAAIGKA